MEPVNNIISVCSECSNEKKIRTQATLTERLTRVIQSGKFFFVKKRFTDGDMAEHMWVMVNPTNVDMTAYVLKGRLNNKPSMLTNIQIHDPVTVFFNEIEDVLE